MKPRNLLKRISQAAREGWTELDLHNADIDELPSEIGWLIALRSLNLRINHLQTLPSGLRKLTALQSLDLNRNSLTTLPPVIGRLTSLQTLDLSSNWLTALPPEIGQLAALTKLTLSNNKLTALPPEIGQLPALTFLNLSWNSLTTLPPEIGLLTALRGLNLSNNHLTALPPEIGRLTVLPFLGLSNNHLTILPPEIGQLAALMKLDLSVNHLTTLPPEIGQLAALTELNLSNNQLTALPPEIGQLAVLTELTLSNSKLMTLPPEIGQLTALTELNLSNNKLTALPPEIGQLTALTKLNLSNNKLTALPPEIGQLTALTELNLSNNKLTALPPEIGQLTALDILDLSNNELTAISPEIGQLIALRILDLSSNELTVLSPEIGQPIALKRLNLSNNHLTTLPSEIGQLINLMDFPLSFIWLAGVSSLNLSGNNLTTLPPEIGQLTALPSLDLSNNYLTTLPPEIAQLANLSFLNLSNNQLTTLPPEIGQLITLKRLDLRNNPNFPLPLEILEKIDDPQTIIRACLDYLTEPTRPLNEIKLVLVGEGSVGKTSLVKRLLCDTFDPNSGKTEGIAIHRWHPTVPSAEGGEKGGQIRVNVWDFGGQEIMHATHQFFLTKRTLYILVLDSRYSEVENRLDYWLTLIRSFGGDSPVLVVGNKADQHSFDLDRRSLLAKYPAVQAILEASCSSGVGITDLRSAIIQQIAAMPHLADPLVRTWFDVKAELEAIDEDYIPYSRYVELCREKNVDHPDSQRVLLGFLHDLGVVLHFPDPRLETTNILNPEWVTQGVYRILNTHLPFAEPGILTWEMLARILDDEPYQEKRMFIVDMMQKFELCYELPDRPNTYLIPDLLPKGAQDTGTWDDTLRFEIHYPVLPGSILTRLIVRMHRLIRTVWRTGVLLACDDNEALVRADLSANHIIIAVRGPSAVGRRELLARVREHLEAIHSSITGLQAAEKVPVPGHSEVPPVDYKWLRELERKGVPEFYPPGLTDPVNVSELLAGVDVRGVPGSGISGAQLSRLRDVLASCGSFESDAALRTLFDDDRLYAWRNRISDHTANREARVNALIDALLEQRTARGESALSLLLHVLAENTGPADGLHATLASLAEEIGRAASSSARFRE